MLQEIRIDSKGDNSHATCNVILTFECVDPSPSDCVEYHDAYVVLHRVEIEPTIDSDYRIQCSLDDSDTRNHFESLLSSYYYGYPVHTAVAA